MAEVAQSARRNQVNAFAASFMGWTLDAYGFFVVVFLVGTLSTAFHVGKALIIVTLTAMLAARPVGAFVFGLLTDRYGRRAVLMLNVSYFILMELLLGFSSSYKFFLIAGVIYGMGFGGMWGVGASLSMEAVPQRWRGLLSGVLQSGYSVGYIIAAIAARFVLPTLGWRWMFWMGGILGLVTLLVSFGAPESEAWKQHRAPSMVAVLRIVGQEWKQFAYLVFMMVFMMFLSHGTQDLYPDFLRSTHGASNSAVAYIAILFNIGAIVGAILFGALSQRLGRRFAMVGALVLSIAVIPWWAFGGTLATLTVGAF
ncbi:MAG TPA: MFS transporter, partial [Candidatus Dormibacteraeota bacterium]|nr:MFS transporter [Candidatus Dormibacteraeota bacterium]